jgi:biotin carboxylase
VDLLGYLGAITNRIREERYDVLLPVHDQVFLLSRFRDGLTRRVGLAVPDFESLEHVQSKVAFIRLLDDLGLPHPRTLIAHDPKELLGVVDYPCYVKLAYSTAGLGVWHVRGPSEMRQVANRLRSTGQFDKGSEILVQEPARGTFCVAQSVFQRGQLLAAHSYRARAIGVGGAARARIGVSHPVVTEHLRRIGQHLNWHGAMHIEYFHDDRTGPSYIEANPRIGETLNATLSGVNLCELLVRVSLGESIEPQAPSRTR